MSFKYTVFGLIVAAFVVAILASNQKPTQLPPPKEIVTAATEKIYSQQEYVGYPENIAIQNLTFGTPLVSKGAHGPEGTIVYPVRVTHHPKYKNDPPWIAVEWVHDIYFWKDPFGTWQFKEEGKARSRVSDATR